MSNVNKPNTFTVGSTIIASEHNENYDTIYNDYNGNIDNTNLSATANIADTKLAQISTAGKVSGAAFTRLDNIPALAGPIPSSHITGFTIGTSVTGHIAYYTNGTGWVVLAAGTAGTVLTSQGGGAAPVWA